MGPAGAGPMIRRFWIEPPERPTVGGFRGAAAAAPPARRSAAAEALLERHHVVDVLLGAGQEPVGLD
jgi:hypothetical protein